MGGIDLKTAVAELAAGQPRPEALADPFQIIVWENIGYLVDDEVRRSLFAELAQDVGLTAAAIGSAPLETLARIARRGGMHPDRRAARLKDAARIVLEDCGGDLAAALASLPLPKARALLKRFPSIGEPGADRILLFGGFAAIPALESNGLRTLVRLGLMAPAGSYAATYRQAVAALARDGEPTREWLMGAYLALREHGRSACKRARPLCLACPLDDVCAHVVVTDL